MNTRELLFVFSLYYTPNSNCYWYPTALRIVLDEGGHTSAVDMKELYSGGYNMSGNSSYYSYCASRAQTFGVLKGDMFYLFNYWSHNNTSYQLSCIKANYKTGANSGFHYASQNNSYMWNYQDNYQYRRMEARMLAEVFDDGIIFRTQGRQGNGANLYATRFSFSDNTFANISVSANNLSAKTLFGNSASDVEYSINDLLFVGGVNTVGDTQFFIKNAEVAIPTSYSADSNNDSIQVKVDGIEYS